MTCLLVFAVSACSDYGFKTANDGSEDLPTETDPRTSAGADPDDGSTGTDDPAAPDPDGTGTGGYTGTGTALPADCRTEFVTDALINVNTWDDEVYTIDIATAATSI